MFVRPAVRRAVLGTAVLATLLLGADLLSATAPAIAANDIKVDRGPKVEGASAKALPAPAKPASSKSSSSRSALPDADIGSATTFGDPGSRPPLHVRATDGTSTDVVGDWQQVGDSPVRVAPATHGTVKKQSKTGLPVASLDTTVLGADAREKYGIDGFAVRLRSADAASGTVGVQIPNDLLTGTYGADYTARLRWVQIADPGDGRSARKLLSNGAPVAAAPVVISGDTVAPAPEAATPQIDGGKGQAAAPKASVANGTVVTPTVSGASTLLVALAGPSSSAGTGSFAATPVNQASTWDVSAQTGGFAWNYDMRVPPAAAGPTPDLGLAYNSQAVDGESGSSQNQPSAVGEGWQLTGGGSITRVYQSCPQITGLSGAVATAAAASGDLCWNGDNAVLTLDGHSGVLVRDQTTGAWKLQSDDGTRIQHLSGTTAPAGAPSGCASNGTYDTDCWLVTTTDGTDYYFGLNQLPGWSSGKATTNSTWTVPVYGSKAGEPCYNATSFAASSCTQAWQWNLDYVVDVHGNAESLYYNAQQNKYAQNKSTTTATTYNRGGSVDHIDYGFSNGNAYATNAASDQVVFGYDGNGRCVTGCTAEANSGLIAKPTTPANYPDVPFDQDCTGTTCVGLNSPTFWSTSMLKTVTTRALISGSYQTVDTWTLGHSFPDPGDTAAGTTAALWMTQVQHQGTAGTATLTEPATVFYGSTKQNRVWVYNGYAPLDKYRISSIQTSLGAVISVNYAPADCTAANASAIMAAPESNTHRCYPQWWSPQVTPAVAPVQDLFNKFVVTSVIADPKTGGGADNAQETDYVYSGTPAWRYDNSPLTVPARRTWSTYAGYNTVEVRVGSASTPAQQQTTAYTFFQGLDGDRASASGGTKSVKVTGSTTVPDSLAFAGTTRETRILNGVGGAVISDTVDTPTVIATSANDGTIQAYKTGVGDELLSQPVSTGGNRTVHTVTSFDATYGLPTTTNVTRSDAPTTCSTVSYAAANTTAWIIGKPSENSQVQADCGSLAAAAYPAAAISDTKTSYDGAAWGAAPTKGDPTSTQIVDSYSGATASTAHWVTASTTAFDAFGRPTSVTDVLGHTTTTAYTPSATAAAGSGPLTSTAVTNTAPFNWVTTTAYNPEWGVPTSVTDPNAKVTTATYDALGRVVGVWLPNRPQATYPTGPNTSYQYGLSTTTPNWVLTSKLVSSGTATEYDLYDGLGRMVQTQKPSDGSGTVVSDTLYDTAGRVNLVNNPYWTTSAITAGTLFVPASQQQMPSSVGTTYDGAGRTVASTLSGGGIVQYTTQTAYPGADRIDTTPPSGGIPTTSITNSAGQQTALTQYLSSTPAPTAPQQTSTYTYNALGKMATMVDPAGNTSSWAYDVLGHQTRAVDPDTGITTSTYDDAGNLLSTTDARGVTISSAYDALNRVTATYQGAVGSGSQLTSTAFDSLAKGQVTATSSFVGSTPGTPGAAYTRTVTGYSALYQPNGDTLSIPAGAPAFAGTSYTTSYIYGVSGQINRRTDPAEGGIPSEKIDYGYTANGNWATLIGGATMVDGVVYTGINDIGQINRDPISSSTTIGLYTGYSRNAATHDIITIGSTSIAGTTHVNLGTHNYTRNNAGTITADSVYAAGVATDTQCYGYDALQELTAAWTPSSNDCSTAPSSTSLGGPAPYWTSYGIDTATGNRTSVTQNPTSGTGTASTDTYAYPAGGSSQPHAVQSITHAAGGVSSTDTYGYDASGNTTKRPGQTLTWNAVGKPDSVTVGAGTQRNVYDASGGLLLQVEPDGSATLFNGDTELHVAAGSSTVTAVRTYASPDGLPVAERTTAAGVTGSKLFWVSANVDGSVDVEVDAGSGTVSRRYTDPYGNARGPAVSWSDGHGFLNKPVSAATGLTTVGARLYDPVLGRFVSVDSVLAPMNPQQNNGYSYSANNPVTKSDPDGKCYVSGSDFINHFTNCGGGKGVTAPQVKGKTQYAPPPGTYDAWAINRKGDSHAVKGHWKSPEAIPDPIREGPMPDQIYRSWAQNERYNQMREYGRQKPDKSAVIELDVEPGSGVCGGIDVKLIAGGSAELCRIRTLDGTFHTTVGGGLTVGVGEGATINASAVQTTAQSGADLAGVSVGAQAQLGLGVVGTGSAQENFGQPGITQRGIGLGLGEGAFVGVGFSATGVLF